MSIFLTIQIAFTERVTLSLPRSFFRALHSSFCLFGTKSVDLSLGEFFRIETALFDSSPMESLFHSGIGHTVEWIQK